MEVVQGIGAAQNLPVFMMGCSGGVELTIRGPVLSSWVIGGGGLCTHVNSSALDIGPALCEQRQMLLAMKHESSPIVPHQV